ncbi:MAG: ubiquinone/menaquinone biosynthesis C-methylase UbiE [Glaciecola sp.]
MKSTSGLDNVNFVCGNASKMDVPDASCDVLVTINTVYFYDDLLVVFKEMKRVIAPGGHLL